ncbi:MAG: hypothetical protein ACLTYB_08205 [Clostridium paraputrificum]
MRDDINDYKIFGDYNDLVEELIDVHLIGMVIEFIKLKLDDM